VLDALFGAIAFVYIYWIGYELGGIACGLAALLVLFTLDPIIFDHGLRSDNMEASVVLCYSGGLFHFWRWATAPADRHSTAHRLAVAGFFTLGFLTKFVAALFLPLVAGAALAWQTGGLVRLRQEWRAWLWPAALALALILPWFVYQTVIRPDEFWRTLLEVHVLERFTTGLDPSHLRPWHFYFSQTWKELGFSRSQLVAGAGLVTLVVVAVRGRTWLPRLVLVWGLLPLILISAGSSKLIHYAYPFWPPLALGAGLALSLAFRTLEGRFEVGHGTGLASLVPKRLRSWQAMSTRPKRILVALAGVSAALALWTAVVGPVTLQIGSVPLFRNSSVLRPLLISGVLVLVAGLATTAIRLVGVILLCLTLPFDTYLDKLHALGRPDHPIRAMRDCMLGVQASTPGIATGVLSASVDEMHHAYYYYLWRTGPWVWSDAFRPAAVVERLTTAAEQAPVLLARRDYDALVAETGGGADQAGDLAGVDATVRRSAWQALQSAVAIEDRVIAVLPGPYQGCVGPVLAGGGRSVDRAPSRP